MLQIQNFIGRKSALTGRSTFGELLDEWLEREKAA